MVKNIILAILAVSIVPYVHAKQPACIEMNPIKVRTVEANVSHQFLLEASNCTIRLTDENNPKKILSYDFTADGSTVSKLPQGFFDIQNERLKHFGVKLIDGAYVSKQIDTYNSKDYSHLQLVGDAIFTARIVVPVTVDFEINANASVYTSPTYGTEAFLFIENIHVKSVKGLPQGVSEYVGKAIGLAVRIAKGMMKFQLSSIH